MPSAIGCEAHDAMRLAALALDAFWIALGLLIATQGARIGVLGADGPAGGFVPLVAGAALAAGGAALLAKDRGRAARDARFFVDAPGARRVLLVCAGIAGILLAMPRLGFLTAAFAMMAFLLSLLDRRPLRVLAIALASTAATWALFDRLLGTPLPRGPFGF